MTMSLKVGRINLSLIQFNIKNIIYASPFLYQWNMV